MVTAEEKNRGPVYSLWSSEIRELPRNCSGVESSPRAAVLEPTFLGPMLHERHRCSEKPAHPTREQALLVTARDRLHAARPSTASNKYTTN